MLVFGGLAHAPLQLRALTASNLCGKHLLSRIPSIQGLQRCRLGKRERSLSTIVAEVIVGGEVDGSFKKSSKKKVNDNEKNANGENLSKEEEEEASTAGRRKRNAAKLAGTPVSAELELGSGLAKGRKRVTKKIQEATALGGEEKSVAKTNLSKGEVEEALTSRSPGRRKRNAAKPEAGTGTPVNGELGSGVAKSRKRVTEKIQETTVQDNAARKDGESNLLEAEGSTIRKPTSRIMRSLSRAADDGTSFSKEDSGDTHGDEKPVARRRKPSSESSETTRKRGTKRHKLEGVQMAEVTTEDAILISSNDSTTDDAIHMEGSRSSSSCDSSTALPLEEAAVDASLTRNSGQESKGTVKQEQVLVDGTNGTALQVPSRCSVEGSKCPTFDLSQAMDSMATESSKPENLSNVKVETFPDVCSQWDQANSARPLYLEIEKRRVEEQERRASSPSPRKKKFNLVSEVRFTLDTCSKFGDVNGALSAYSSNREAVKFDLYNYNVLLYLCSSAALGVLAPGKQSRQRPDFSDNQAENGLEAYAEDEVEEDGVVLRGNMAGLSGRNLMGFTKEMMDGFLRKGLEIFEQMQAENVAPNEATFTALARLSVAKRDGDLAFEIVKAMIAAKIPPKLRCYGPALYVYFKRNDPEKAFEVYNHMLVHGVQPEEAELEVLLHLSSKACLGDRVYLLLHHLRETVRDVSQSTVSVIERWFKSDFAGRVTGNSLPGDFDVRCSSLAKGGGWHGLGWLGQGRWNVGYTSLTAEGVCCRCNEQMVTIDITPEDTDVFAKCIASLAFKRESNNSFGIFKDWLDRNGPFETVVDGANVGFYNQRFNGELNFAQLETVVADVQRRSGKWPLIVLHVGRTMKGSGRSSYAQQLLRHWSNAKALYIAPAGSNDDWYWLYAAVKCKSLLVSNDEMRDHIFQLLGREFFPTWKERHQVRFHVTKHGPVFHMPPPYSIIIQETERGSWHIPVSGGDDISSPRKWLCVTRGST
ncbi:uncharacterized protein LOC9655352 [Selaginella moellendorffii]|uniref:uncharacterized protein LOC9655352 n=1 Tax=Selaginella moellendorffii TaxID=88036 RepID=UPI000D1C57D7|nr:uncharacterized protein LOC9655352 [Selaginella moellendorffii]|eukprot:XP_024521173.1 uncharacterized protein LOC9655352 [Selaginella moellendorffii]